MRLVASIRLFVRPSVPLHSLSSGVRLCVCNQWVYAGNYTDLVEWLLIVFGISC